MKPFIKTVLLTGLLAGLLDIISAYVTVYLKTGQFASKMFQYIAGGALGLETSMKGGTGVIILGIFFHFFIAFLFTLFYFSIYRNARLALVNKYIAGLGYGIFVWVVMNLMVLPLSMLPATTIKWSNAVIGLSVLVVMVGMPIAISANRYFRREKI